MDRAGQGCKPGSLCEFRELYANELLALWLGFHADSHSEVSSRHLFQFLDFEGFIRLAYRFS